MYFPFCLLNFSHLDQILPKLDMWHFKIDKNYQKNKKPKLFTKSTKKSTTLEFVLKLLRILRFCFFLSRSNSFGFVLQFHFRTKKFATRFFFCPSIGKSEISRKRKCGALHSREIILYSATRRKYSTLRAVMWEQRKTVYDFAKYRSYALIARQISSEPARLI